jgi:hypothetical protein
MFLAKNFIRNFFALFFSLFMIDAFAKDIFFYYKSIVRLFKLIKFFSARPNSLAPSTPIDLSLYFFKNIMLNAFYLLNFICIFFIFVTNNSIPYFFVLFPLYCLIIFQLCFLLFHFYLFHSFL